MTWLFSCPGSYLSSESVIVCFSYSLFVNNFRMKLPVDLDCGVLYIGGYIVNCRRCSLNVWNDLLNMMTSVCKMLNEL